MCAEYRVPHSVFLDWDQSDRDKAIWWHLRRQQACPGCGTRSDEWNPDRGGDRHAYLGRIEQCPGCVVRERTAAAPEMKQGRGNHVVLHRNPEVDR